MSTPFVNKTSIARKIWGRSDTVLLIFAGASAEFALNKAVDWLYFTGRLPADPIGRLFSTVRYAQAIVFSEEEAALEAIDRINAVHGGVEQSRGARIPEEAYRDVLFMLIDYSIRAFELVERRLEDREKIAVFDVFTRVGMRMGLKGLPVDYAAWTAMRADHLARHLVYSAYTDDLFRQYRKHLGAFRYGLLLRVQRMLAPGEVRGRLSGAGTGVRLPFALLLYPLLTLYKCTRFLGLDRFLRNALLPVKYRTEALKLDKL